MEINYLYYFLGSFTITFILMPFGLKVIRDLNIIDKPNKRKVHNFDTPSGGGLIIFVGISISLIAFVLQYTQHAILSLSYFLGLLILFIMGLMDDKNDLTPKVKLLTQIVSATIFISLSADFINFDILGNKFASLLLTIFFIISIINAYNLIDGLDGLASGLAVISISTLLILLNSDFNIVFYSILGILFAFLRRNSYPAKIFLGDTGSYMLGYSIAVLSILIITDSFNSSKQNYYIISVLLCIGLPIIDTTYAFVRRLLRGHHIFKADKLHIHHVILSYGLSHKNSVSTLYILQSILSIISLYILNYTFSDIYLIIILLLIIKHIFTILKIRPYSFNTIFEKIYLLDKAYIYFFFSIIISLIMFANYNSQFIFNYNFLYICLLVLFINLLFILDKRTRKNNNIDISILASSILMLYFSFINVDNSLSENWIITIRDFIWYPIIIGIGFSLFGLFKEKNDLLESPTEYLILFFACIIMPLKISIPIDLFFLKVVMILIMYKIILQDQIIRKFNIIHFVNILMLFTLILFNI